MSFHLPPSVADTLKYLATFLWNIVLAYIVYMLCRVAYVWENWSIFANGWEQLSASDLIAGSLRFDTSAIAYTHIPYTLLMLLPIALHLRTAAAYQTLCKWLYIIPNATAVVVNLCDAVYSQYTGRRTTSSFFSEFQNDGNLMQILSIELLHHWYLVIIGLALIAMLWLLYRKAGPIPRLDRPVRHIAIAVDAVLLAIAVTLTIGGIRGGFSRAIRPIANSNANQYVNSPQQAAIVLNTPFSLIRTIGKTTFSDPAYFSPSRLDSIYTPLHNSTADTAAPMLRRNVVVIIVESFASEYIGALNDYEGYTPFTDSLIAHSLIFRHSYANGRKSIDGMPSVLSSIPMFIEPFFVTNYSLNRISGIADVLSREGYSTAFFHGAENGSMGFQAFARATGFQHYYGRTEYDADTRFGGEADFDGTWAIWDEPFMQFYALTMSEMQQPFMTAIFTASSHHPYAVPARYSDSLHADGHPMYTCIRYTDHALRHFFATARRQPWYDSTLFVITADHTNYTEQEKYNNDLGRYRVPIIFFDPSGTIGSGCRNAIAQQIDIMPTILGFLGYNRPYIAFGIDLLHTPDSQTWAVSYNQGIYQYIHDSTFIQFDGTRQITHYNTTADPLLHHNLIESRKVSDTTHLHHLQAIIQSYMRRMIDDNLTVREGGK
ncbi:MAG: sulfatase-like hydrolase/transferase [Bacteroidales bacterium]|nr:sulfatase-like hydrolase/transferase [Bacteroidales bacterium]